MLFKGSGVALCTPFTEDGVNFGTYEKLIEFQIENDTDALIVCGTTGEPPTMTNKEQEELVRFAVGQANGRVPVIAGIGGNNTAASLEKAKTYEQAGASGLLYVTPYYNKCTKSGLLAHFLTVADAVSIPIVVYNVPARTNVNLPLDVWDALCGHKNIAMIKEASGNIAQVAEMSRVANGRADIVSGNDDCIVPLLSVGGVGVISVLANILPQYTHDMVMHYLNGDTDKACKMQLKVLPLVSALFCEVNPIPAKTALREMGYDMGPFRLPLTEMEEKNKARLLTEMRAFDLID
ncbi:MAG: 4-hydroxy-tetrahydrodipicolinate synthase [Christensenellaceae bacterium]|jgi:4-hydroxy-tetrahydrodipicolinate synthase